MAVKPVVLPMVNGRAANLSGFAQDDSQVVGVVPLCVYVRRHKFVLSFTALVRVDEHGATAHAVTGQQHCARPE